MLTHVVNTLSVLSTIYLQVTLKMLLGLIFLHENSTHTILLVCAFQQPNIRFDEYDLNILVLLMN